MIRELLLEIITPSRRDERPYLWLLIFVGHAMVGAAFTAPLAEWTGAATGAIGALRLAIGAAYWIIKERGDLRRGGGVRDGFVDTAGVYLGTLYGAIWWPAAILILATAGALLRERHRRTA